MSTKPTESIDLQYVGSYVISSGSGDRCGLSELLAAIASRRPRADSDQVFEACLAACLSLADEGHVRIEMTPACADRPTRDGYTQVPAESAPQVLRDPQSWWSPRDTLPRYWLVATQEGRAAYISDDTISL